MAGWTEGYHDELPYVTVHFAEMAPNRLDFAMLRHGCTPPARHDAMTYCELGCGYGYTTNILAAANPDITFYACDFNPSHIADARALAEEAGLTNIHFFDLSFAEFQKEDLPQFDYIAAHGVLSWVSDQARAQIRDILTTKLKAGGAFYASYNAMPGIGAVLPLRKLYYDLYNKLPGTAMAKIVGLSQFVDKFIEQEPDYFVKNPVARTRHQSTKSNPAGYFAHEFLNADWTPFFFYDLCKELADTRLSFAGSANFAAHSMLVEFEKNCGDLFDQVNDPLMQEQLKDYLLNTAFRRDVFVRGPRKMSGIDMVKGIDDTPLALLMSPEDCQTEITIDGRQFRLNEAHHQPLLELLADGPRTIGQLRQDPAFQEASFSSLFSMICCAITVGQIGIMRDPQAGIDREPANRLNRAIVRRSKSGHDMNYLAAPDLGYGLPCGKVYQFFLNALSEGLDPADEAFKAVQLMNEKMHMDGKPLDDPEEALKALKDAAEKFSAGRLKLLEQSGIAA